LKATADLGPAAKIGDEVTVRNCLAKGADIDAPFDLVSALIKNCTSTAFFVFPFASKRFPSPINLIYKYVKILLSSLASCTFSV